MSMFTLSISCLTISNLPWFINLTFQVPVQCCSLQHQNLLPSPVTSTTGCCFCSGSISLFFLELFSPLISSSILGTYTWGIHLSMSYLFVFSYCSWGSQARNIDHLTCFLRNLYAGQEATVRTGHGTTDWFQIGKGVRQDCILSPCLFNLYAEYITRNARLDEAQSGIKIAGRNINNLRYADDTTLMAESERH